LAGAPLSDRAGRGKQPYVIALFCLLFVGVGLVMLYFLTIKPGARMLDARNWPAVPCVVLSSAVESHEGDDSTTYSIEIEYQYQVGGQVHTSDRYEFIGGSSSGYDGKKAVVDRYPPGTQTVSFVNPADPSDAVLNRGLTPKALIGLAPLLFILVGAAGVWGSLRRASQPGALPNAPWSPGVAVERTARDGRVCLKPKITGKQKLVGLILIALFWNGIICIPISEIVQGFRNGSPEWGLTLFMIPFELVGLGLIGGVFHAILGLFNPRPVITLGAAQVPLGGELALEWSFTRIPEKVSHFQVYIEAREEATYRRGTDTCTDKEVFLTMPIVDTPDPREMRSGEALILIPADTMHSFSATHNKVVWALCIRGKIPRWPDISDDYELAVVPQALAVGFANRDRL
jgi:hypothetical protein